MIRIFILCLVALIFGCATATDNKFKSGQDLSTLNYVLNCDNAFTIEISLHTSNNTYEYKKKSSASFALQDLIVQQFEGKAIKLQDKKWRLMRDNNIEHAMILGVESFGIFVLRNYDAQKSDKICEGAEFGAIY